MRVHCVLVCGAPMGLCGPLFVTQSLRNLHLLHPRFFPLLRLQSCTNGFGMTHSVMSSPGGRWTASLEQRWICFQRRARTFSPDFLSLLLTVELGRATPWGQLRAVSSLGRGEEGQTVPGGPSERQLRNSPQERLPGTRENRAGLCLASQGTVAWAPALPTREAVFLTRSLAHPSLALAPSRGAAPSWTWDLGTGRSLLRPGQLWSRPLLVARGHTRCVSFLTTRAFRSVGRISNR